MKNATKLIALFVFCSFAFSAKAQFKLLPANNELKTNLEKVVADFPTHFASLKGEMIVEDPQTVEYKSLLDFKMVEDNSITQYKSAKPIYSWKATFLTSEEFDEASKKYKWLCNQLKGMSIKYNNSSFSLNGNFDAPDESKKFSTSVFSFNSSSDMFSKLKVEATMEFEFPEWKVQ